MAFWFTLFLWTATFVISDYFRQRLPAQTPSGLGDFSIPTATEGRYVPLCFGTMPIQGPNVVWYGDFLAVPRTVETGVIFKRDETIGYSYQLAMQLGLVRGETAGIRRIWVGDDVVWDYDIDNGSVLGTVCDVTRPDLFGGTDQGGGFTGRFRLFNGSSSQSVSTYLATQGITHLPAYRGFSYVVLTNQTEDGGADIGESNTLRHFKFELQMFDTIGNGGLGDALGLANNKHYIGDDLNPISLAYDVFTNTDWGRGLPPGDINLANFRTAAETVWDEGLGFSTVIDQVQNTAQLLDTIEQHIDGYIGPNPTTGQLEVNLARQDYTLASEFQADETNIISVSKFSRGENNQTFNEVLLQYTDRAKDYGDTYAPAQDLANLIVQGRPRSKTLRYQGVHNATVASKIVWRDLRGLARSLASCTVEVNRTAWNLRPGDVISLTDADVQVTNLPCRVIAVQQGNPLEATIVLDVVEDIFGSEFVGFVAPPASEFIPPTQDVIPFAENEQLVIEAPYIINQQDPTAPDSAPRLFVAAAKNAGGSLTSYLIKRRTRTPPTAFSGGYTEIDNISGTTKLGTLRSALGGWATGNGSFTIDVDPITGSLDDLIGTYTPAGVNQLAGVAVISPGQWNEEWIAMTGIVDNVVSPEASSITLTGVSRAALDSVMHPHDAGERVWFIWTGGTALPLEEFTPGDGVDVKLLPVSQTDAILETDSPEPPSAVEVSLLDNKRTVRPLPPISVSLNDTAFPTTDVDFDTAHVVSPEITGVKLTPTVRDWRNLDVLGSVGGLDFLQSAFDPTIDSLRLSWWIYDADAASPATGRASALASGLHNALTTGSSDDLFITRQSIIDGGFLGSTFNAILELETEHAPAEIIPASPDHVPSREVMYFPFTAIGTFDIIVPFSEVVFLSHFDGADALASPPAGIDESNSAHPISFINSAQLDTAIKVFGDSALLTAAAADYASVPSSSEFAYGTSDFTIEFRFYTTSVSAGTFVIYDQRTTLNQPRPTIYRSTDGLVYYVSNAERISASSVLSINTWYACAVSRVNGVTRMFLDGVQVGSDYADTTNYEAGPIILGTAGDALGGAASHTGSIEEVRVINGTGLYPGNYTIETEEFWFHRVALLSGFEGADGEAGGSPEYLSEDKNLHVFTFVGNAQIDTAQKKFNASSLLLDGKGDYVNVPDHAHFDLGTEDFTIEAFVRFAVLPSTGSPNNGMAIVAKWKPNPSPNQRGWIFMVENSNELRFYWSTTGADTLGQVSTDAAALSVDTWYHMAVTRESGVLRMFLDGTQLTLTGDPMASGSPPVTDSIYDSVEDIRIGALNNFTPFERFFNGHIDDVRFIVGRAEYTTGFTPPAEPHPRD